MISVMRLEADNTKKRKPKGKTYDYYKKEGHTTNAY